MKRTACFLALLSAALFFLACSHRSHSVQQQINIAIENDIQTLDPATLSDPYTSRIVWQMYEGLIGLDENGRELPLLAESWDPSADYRIWTFHLRSGVYYHRSAVFRRSDSTRQVTAEDVKYSLTRFGRGFGSFVFSGLVEGFDAFLQKEVKAVSGFVVIDSLTFQFHLLQPDPYFIYRLTSPYLGVMPPEAVEDDPSAFGRTVCVGTGPFYLKDRTETRVSLAKNDHSVFRSLSRRGFAETELPQQIETDRQNDQQCPLLGH
jgi:ABC-type transport system substrate-binding protein